MKSLQEKHGLYTKNTKLKTKIYTYKKINQSIYEFDRKGVFFDRRGRQPGIFGGAGGGGKHPILIKIWNNMLKFGKTFQSIFCFVTNGSSFLSKIDYPAPYRSVHKKFLNSLKMKNKILNRIFTNSFNAEGINLL